jgi:hypothetical protein
MTVMSTLFVKLSYFRLSGGELSVHCYILVINLRVILFHSVIVST